MASLTGILAWLMNAVTQVVALCVVRPWLGAFWRRRSALADAGAVELTRHPGGLASALPRLTAHPVAGVALATRRRWSTCRW